MSRTNLSLMMLVSALLLGFGTPTARATTYIVGTCKPGTQFSKIQSALDATPAPTIVEVCPGSYPEQIAISKPVTLEGVAAGNSSFATVVVPAGGLVNNTTLAGGDAAAAQILVQNAGGAVNLTNLVVDATSGSASYVVSILYKNTPGTVNHMVAFNVSGESAGFGIYVEGGSSDPKVTIENSTISDDQQGILVQGISDGSLTTAINTNLINDCIIGVQVTSPNTTTTINGNVLTDVNETAIILEATAGSVTNNTIAGGFQFAQTGIELGADGMSIESNKFYNIGDGIYATTQITNSQITGNSFTTLSAEGIIINCNSAFPLSKVHSNTFMDVFVGYATQSGPTTGNTFVGVLVKWTTCP
ncbi:MAG: right-handed parallel beta-helix repeat-containing protein [Candidatus Acidiferrales bacterium]